MNKVNVLALVFHRDGSGMDVHIEVVKDDLVARTLSLKKIT